MFQRWNLVWHHLLLCSVCVFLLQLVKEPANERASLANVGWGSKIWLRWNKGHGEECDFTVWHPQQTNGSLCMFAFLLFALVPGGDTSVKRNNCLCGLIPFSKTNVDTKGLHEKGWRRMIDRLKEWLETNHSLDYEQPIIAILYF